MKNYLKRWIHNVKDYFTFLSQNEIFDISKKSISFLGDHNENDFIMRKKNCGWYVWKIFSDENGREKKLYNDNFVILSLAYLFYHSWEGHKIILKIWRNISELANWKDDVEDYMSLEEEKKYIMNIAKRYFPDRYKDLVLVDIEEDNPELFKILREKWINWLDDWDRQPELSESFTSLDIAKYLYRVCKNNEVFYALIKKLISEDQIKKTKDNYPNYYGLVEIACRIKDLLNGITIQGWADRQNLYDDFIKLIIGDRWKIDKFPELQNLQDFCKSKLWEKEKFERVYIYKKIYTKLLEENEKKLSHRNKYWKITSAISLALLLVLSWSIGWYHFSNKKQRKQQQDKNEKLLEKTLLDKSVRDIHFDHGDHQSVDGLKFRIDEATENMYNSFVKIYGTWDIYSIWNIDPEKLIILKSLMREYFLKSDTNWVLINVDDVYRSSAIPSVMPEILHKKLKKFVDEHSWFLTDLWFNITPWPKMRKYIDACKYTIELKWNVVINYAEWPWWPLFNIEFDSTKYQLEFNNFIKELEEKRNYASEFPTHTFAHRRYGQYMHSNGKLYDVMILWANDREKFLLAYEFKPHEKYFDTQRLHVYRKDLWELISKDFLENRYMPNDK